MRFTLTVQNTNDLPQDVRIISPAHNATTKNRKVVLLAEATEVDAGDTLNFLWLDGETVLGTGPQAVVTLAPGLHRILLRVTDSSGSPVTVTHDITILGKPKQTEERTAWSGALDPGAGLLLAAIVAGLLLFQRHRRRAGPVPQAGPTTADLDAALAAAAGFPDRMAPTPMDPPGRFPPAPPPPPPADSTFRAGVSAAVPGAAIPSWLAESGGLPSQGTPAATWGGYYDDRSAPPPPSPYLPLTDESYDSPFGMELPPLPGHRY